MRGLHCAYAQGYHLSRPIDGERFEALLAEKKSWPPPAAASGAGGDQPDQ